MKMFWKFWSWLGRALSENGEPSSKRVFALLFVLTVCGCIIYEVCATHDFHSTLYYGGLATIWVLTGVATVPQLLRIWRGGSAPAASDEPKKKDDAEG